MSVQVITPPALEPVTLAETKAFLQLDSDHEDDLIAGLIQSARETAEDITGRALITRSLRQIFRGSPARGVFTLAKSPLVQITQVQYINAEGVAAQIDNSTFYVDLGQSRLITLAGFPKPAFVSPAEALWIDYTAGYGPAMAAVPASLRMAILLIVRELFEHRGEGESALPLRAQALLAPFAAVRL
jgi:uncharacterized phiE125 gp8 family phage protein